MCGLIAASCAEQVVAVLAGESCSMHVVSSALYTSIVLLQWFLAQGMEHNRCGCAKLTARHFVRVVKEMD